MEHKIIKKRPIIDRSFFIRIVGIFGIPVFLIGDIFIYEGLIFSMGLDPQWVSVFVAIIYAAFTLFIVLESRKSRKELQEREQKRAENRKLEIRKSILGELFNNLPIMEMLYSDIDDFLSEKIHNIDKDPFEISGYESLKIHLGRLPVAEIEFIGLVYWYLKEVDKDFRAIKENKKDLNELKSSLKSLKGVVDKTIEICMILKENYSKLLMGEINENDLIEIFNNY